MNLQAVRFLWIEPDLINYSGHMFNTVKTVVPELLKSERVGQFHLLIDVSSEISESEGGWIAKSLDYQRKISGFVYTGKMQKLLPSIKFQIVCMWSFYKTVSEYLKVNESTQPTVLYLNTCLPFHLPALGLLLLSHKGIRSLILTLRISNYYRGRRSRRFYFNKIFYWLSKMFIKKIYFVTDSELLQREYKDDFLLNVDLLGIPHRLEHFAADTVDGIEPESFVIGLLGPPGIPKRTCYTLKILLLLESQTREELGAVTILVHGYSRSKIVDEEVACLTRKFKRFKAVLRTTSLDTEAYVRDLAACNLVLLPYDKFYYARNTSGIFFDALSLNKRIIVTEGTWMHLQHRKYGLCEVVDSKRSSLMTAIKYALEHQEANKTARGRHDFLLQHSPQRFATDLIKYI